MSDKTLAPMSRDSTPATEVPAAPELGAQNPSEPLMAKKAARKKAAPKKADAKPPVEDLLTKPPVVEEVTRRALLEEVMMETTPEPEPAALLRSIPLEEALPLFRESFLHLKEEIQKAIVGYNDLL